ncbi:MAG: hypothetical protein EOP87_03290 [Verrucomicrobiaceae bacterium]|nr:MAG: hypothetical protein EOP87_03290 [Verrucomicrobiaceae bacterium]
MRITIMLAILAPTLGLVSCIKDVEKRPAPPPGSQSSQIPWNTPVAGQGQGQFGMMEQNRYRR